MTSRVPNRHLRIGLFTALAFAGTFGVWATFSELQGAVVTTGELAYTDGREIEIRHGDGGMVVDLMAQAGDAVKAGDTLLRFDDAQLNVERQILEDRLFETRLRDLRLQALIDGEPFPTLTGDLAAAVAARPELQRSVERERGAHEASVSETTSVIARLEDARKEARRAAAAADAVATGLAQELAVVDADLVKQHDLLSRGLAQRAIVSALERDAIRIANTKLQTLGERDAQTARVDTLSLEAERELATRRSALVEALALTAETIPELEERLAGVAARQERLTVAAPTDGHVHMMLVAATGVTVTPGSVVASLVPDTGRPKMIAPIAPTQIDQVRVGQAALLRPMTRAHNDLEITATVVRVGEALRRDEATGAGYYEVILEPDLDALAARGDGLVSGTPFEVAIQTTARTPLAYFLEPVQRSFRRAMRE